MSHISSRKSKIEVVFDNNAFIHQTYGGVSLYYVELLNYFFNNGEVNASVAGIFNRNEYLKDRWPHLSKVDVSNWNFRGSNRVIQFLNKLTISLAKSTSTPDIHHLTYYDPYYLKLFSSQAVKVVTIFDMIQELMGGLKTVIDGKRKLIDSADLILAISQNTADDIIKLYNVDPAKIVVTHLASSLRPPMPGELEVTPDLPENFILYVGLRHWYKNFENFVRGVAPILKDKGLTLIFAGGGELTREENELLAALQLLPMITYLPLLNDRYLAFLYSKAICFIYPSKYEGFGIPILEAMNCDCPCVISATGCFEEVAGDAAEYFDPNDIDSITAKCRYVIENDDVRNKLVEKGRIRREMFSWKLTGEATLKAYYSKL